MGEWMSAEVYVRVPDQTDIDAWLAARADRYQPDRRILAIDADADPSDAPAPISALLASAAAAGFEWEWEPERRLLSHGSADLEVNYGLDEWFTDLAVALRETGWGYHFESAGKYELPGECWEWMPGWPAERTLVQAGEVTALDATGLRAAFDEAAALGVDPADHLATILSPWPGWATSPTPPT